MKFEFQAQWLQIAAIALNGLLIEGCSMELEAPEAPTESASEPYRTEARGDSLIRAADEVSDVREPADSLDSGDLAEATAATDLCESVKVTRKGDRNGTCKVNDCSLREAIKLANGCSGPGTRIDVPEGHYHITLGTLTITRSLRLEGAGKNKTIIDGGTGVQLFRLNHGSGFVRIANMNLESGQGSGGAIRITDASHTVLVDCILALNRSAGHGGAIYLDGGELRTSGTEFMLNTAERDGGAIYVRRGTLALERSSAFTLNAAQRNGGAVHLADGQLTVRSTNFVVNTAHENGGAIYAPAGYVSVHWGRFSSNRAILDGGAVFAKNAGFLVVTDSEFTNNKAQDGAAVDASELESLGISDTKFSSNDAEAVAGAVRVDQIESVSIRRANFERNTAGTCGGALLVRNSASSPDAPGVLDENVFTANTAAACGGGAIHLQSGSFDITENKFLENQAIAGPGGAIVNGSQILVKDCTFSSNHASGDGSGAGIGGALINNAEAKIVTSLFSSNHADQEGGAIWNNAPATLENTTLSYNKAVRGGAIFQRRSTVWIKNGTIYGNEAPDAAALYVFGNPAEPSDSARLHLNHTIVSYSWSGGTAPLCRDLQSESTQGSERGLLTYGHNLQGDDSCGLTDATDLLLADPRLTGLMYTGGKTLAHRPLHESPVINAGSQTASADLQERGCAPKDQRSLSRPQPYEVGDEARCDIGAVELNPLN